MKNKDVMSGVYHEIAQRCKRVIDIVVAIIVLCIAFPFLLIAGIAIFLEDGGPFLFRQRRAGLNGATFELLKLRSMRLNSISPNELGQVSTGHTLVTKTGNIIRRLKIDELPQLVNVLLGEMSLVGPRPTLPEQIQEYNAFQLRRLSVQPGLTGWAQVNGNISLDWDERIVLDVWYIDHWSLLVDCKILFRTIAVVIDGEHPNWTNLEIAKEYARSVDRDG